MKYQIINIFFVYILIYNNIINIFVFVCNAFNVVIFTQYYYSDIHFFVDLMVHSMQNIHVVVNCIQNTCMQSRSVSGSKIHFFEDCTALAWGRGVGEAVGSACKASSRGTAGRRTASKGTAGRGTAGRGIASIRIASTGAAAGRKVAGIKRVALVVTPRKLAKDLVIVQIDHKGVEIIARIIACNIRATALLVTGCNGATGWVGATGCFCATGCRRATECRGFGERAPATACRRSGWSFVVRNFLDVNVIMIKNCTQKININDCMKDCMNSRPE